MKLERLTAIEAHEFAGLKDVKIDLTKPIAFIVGPNGAGKTSVADAIEFAISGKARTAGTFKAAADLARDGSDDMEVVLRGVDADGPLEIRRTAKSAATKADKSPFVAIACHPDRFIAMEPGLRAKLLAGARQDADDEAVAAAVRKGLGDIPEELKLHLRRVGVDIRQVDVLEREIIEYRRQCKRNLKEAETTLAAIEDTITPAAADFDLDAAVADVAAIEARIAKAEQIKAEAGAVIFKKQQISQLETEIAELQGQIVKPAPSGGPAVRMAARLAAAVPEILAYMNPIKSGKVKCPICAADYEAADMRAALNALQADAEELAAAEKKRLDLIERNEAIARQIERLTRQRDETSKVLTGMSSEGMSEKAYDKLGELVAERDALKLRIREAKANADAETRAAAEAAKAEAMRSLVAITDRLAVALADGGPIKTAIAGLKRPLPIDDDLLEAWGLSGALEWNDAGEVTLGGRDISAGSDSERFRAGAVLAMAAAKEAGLPFVVLDGAERLDRGNLLALLGASPQIPNVVVLAAIDPTPQQREKMMAGTETVEVYEIRGGRVVTF